MNSIEIANAIMSGEGRSEDVYMRAREILDQETILRRSTLGTLRSIADQLAQMPGERLIAFVSDGLTTLSDGGVDTELFAAATSTAVKRGIVIYCFNPSGLTVPVEFTAASPVQGSSRSPTLGAAFGSYMAESRTDQQNTLRSLADNSGGEAYLNSNDMATELAKMLSENQIYYAIAYYSDARTDKSFRKITLRVKNHSDYKIRTQKSYRPAESVAPTGTDTSGQLFRAIMRPLPLTGLEVASTAGFLSGVGDDAQVTLRVHIGPKALLCATDQEKCPVNFELMVVMLDARGTMSNGSSETIKASLTQDELLKAQTHGYDLSRRLKLNPGMHQVRVGVRDLNSGQIGTSMSFVEVPALSRNRIVLSSLFLGRQTEVSERTGDKGVHQEFVVGPATFKSGEQIFYRLVAYKPGSQNAESDCSVKLELLHDEETIYASEWQPISQRTIRQTENGLEVRGRLTVTDAGFYRLRISIQSQKPHQIATQEISFEIAQ